MSAAKFLNYISLLLLFFLFAQIADAQSGRKAPKYPQYPTQSPQPTNDEKTPAETQESKKTEDEKLIKTTLLVATNFQEETYYSFPYPENMSNWVINRLMQSKVLEVYPIGNSMNRSEAVKRAKTETESLTVWLEVMGSRTTLPGQSDSSNPNSNVGINYYIYSPVTGKTKYSGTIYINQSMMSRNTIQNKIGIACYPGIYGNDLLLLKASLETADRIMSNLSVPIPPICSSRF